MKSHLKHRIFQYFSSSSRADSSNLTEKSNVSHSQKEYGDVFEPIGPSFQPPQTFKVAPSYVVSAASMTLAGRLARAAFEIPAPVRAVARMSAKSGAAGAVVDAALGGFNTIGPLSRGEINLKQASTHVLSEGACGFLTAGAGTAGSISAYMITGSLGPIVLASGMASSMAARWGYRSIIGETLPQTSEHSSQSQHSSFENIGPEEDVDINDDSD